MKLPLAVDIADFVVEATSVGSEIDVPEKAHELIAAHPEADATTVEVEETLQEELASMNPPAAHP